MSPANNACKVYWTNNGIVAISVPYVVGKKTVTVDLLARKPIREDEIKCYMKLYGMSAFIVPHYFKQEEISNDFFKAVVRNAPISFE